MNNKKLCIPELRPNGKELKVNRVPQIPGGSFNEKFSQFNSFVFIHTVHQTVDSIAFPRIVLFLFNIERNLLRLLTINILLFLAFSLWERQKVLS